MSDSEEGDTQTSITEPRIGMDEEEIIKTRNWKH